MPRRHELFSVDRLKALSDGVFAIVITLLVLNLIPDAARSPQQLLDAWPSYLAYLAAFLSIGSIWLNHNAAFARIREADAPVLTLNLVLLLGSALIPWPTVLIADALQNGNHIDQVAAMIVFSIVSLLLSAPWSALDRYVRRHPALLVNEGDAAWFRWHSRMSDVSFLLAIVTVGVSFLSPLTSLVIYLVSITTFLIVRLFERVR